MIDQTFEYGNVNFDSLIREYFWLFRSAFRMPTSRSYPRHLVQFCEKKKKGKTPQNNFSSQNFSVENNYCFTCIHFLPRFISFFSLVLVLRIVTHKALRIIVTRELHMTCFPPSSRSWRKTQYLKKEKSIHTWHKKFISCATPPLCLEMN